MHLTGFPVSGALYQSQPSIMRLPSVPKRDDACHIIATIEPAYVGVVTHQHANCATNQFRFISDSPTQIAQCAAELYFGARNIQFGNTVHIRFTATKQFCLYAPQYSRVLHKEINAS